MCFIAIGKDTTALYERMKKRPSERNFFKVVWVQQGIRQAPTWDSSVHYPKGETVYAKPFEVVAKMSRTGGCVKRQMSSGIYVYTSLRAALENQSSNHTIVIVRAEPDDLLGYRKSNSSACFRKVKVLT